VPLNLDSWYLRLPTIESENCMLVGRTPVWINIICRINRAGVFNSKFRYTKFAHMDIRQFYAAEWCDFVYQAHRCRDGYIDGWEFNMNQCRSWNISIHENTGYFASPNVGPEHENMGCPRKYGMVGNPTGIHCNCCNINELWRDNTLNSCDGSFIDALRCYVQQGASKDADGTDMKCLHQIFDEAVADLDK